MERFNYANLAAVYEEDAEILQLLELESYGDRGDEIDELNRLKETNMEGGGYGE